MVNLKNNFDGGTDGVVISPGNSGGASGDAFAAATVAAFSDEQAHSGELSMLLSGAAEASYVRWGSPESKNLAIRMYLWLPEAVAATDLDIAQVRTSIPTNISTIRISGYSSPASALRFRAGSTNTWTAAGAMPVEAWVRVEVLFEQGTTAADGRARIAYFLGDDLAAVEDSGWIEEVNLGGDGAEIINVLLGKISGSAAPAAFVDDIAIRTGVDYTGGFIGPDLPNGSPIKRWDAATSAYVDLSAHAWDGSAYIPIVGPVFP